MGVLTCDRKGCGSIMCGRHSTIFGYICHECFEQLRYSNLSISDFMNTDINEYESEKRDRYEELNKEFVSD